MYSFYKIFDANYCLDKNVKANFNQCSTLKWQERDLDFLKKGGD